MAEMNEVKPLEGIASQQQEILLIAPSYFTANRPGQNRAADEAQKAGEPLRSSL